MTCLYTPCPSAYAPSKCHLAIATPFTSTNLRLSVVSAPQFWHAPQRNLEYHANSSQCGGRARIKSDMKRRRLCFAALNLKKNTLLYLHLKQNPYNMPSSQMFHIPNSAISMILDPLQQLRPKAVPTSGQPCGLAKLQIDLGTLLAKKGLSTSVLDWSNVIGETSMLAAPSHLRLMHVRYFVREHAYV